MSKLRSTSILTHDIFKKWKKNSLSSKKNSSSQRTQFRRKNSVREKSGGYSRRTVAATRRLSPLARLIYTLREKGVRFQVAGMSAAILQGVPALFMEDATLDFRTVDFRIESGKGEGYGNQDIFLLNRVFMRLGGG